MGRHETYACDQEQPHHAALGAAGTVRAQKECPLATAARAPGMKTDRIRTDIIDIIFVFIFLVGFRFKYG
jgi:hypothetical protein